MGDALPLPIPVPGILPGVSSDSDDDDIMAQTFKFTYEDDLLETCRLAAPWYVEDAGSIYPT